MSRHVMERLHHALQVAAGFVVLHRWPWPVWRLRGAGELPVGDELFRFCDLAAPQLVWWAHEARRRRWEPVVIRELSRALRPGDVFFDLGAFVGALTLLASRLVGPGGRVIAFEPDPAARALLERNLEANGASNVTVEPYAVGDHAGSVTFLASGNSVGRVTTQGDLEVRQVTLDGYCAERDVRPTVMKVDIEGGEAAALGNSAVVRDVREIILEIHEPPLRDQGVDPAGLLERLGPHELLEPTDKGNYGVLIRPRGLS